MDHDRAHLGQARNGETVNWGTTRVRVQTGPNSARMPARDDAVGHGARDEPPTATDLRRAGNPGHAAASGTGGVADGERGAAGRGGRTARGRRCGHGRGRTGRGGGDTALAHTPARVGQSQRPRPRAASAAATPRPGAGRRREVPDRIVLHAPTALPGLCRAAGAGRLVGRRQVIDLPPIRAEVVEHRVLERTCRRCGLRSRGTMPDLSEQVGAQRRVAWPVAAWVAMLRTRLRLPLAQLQWLLARGWGLRLSVGELSALVAEAARAGRPAYEALRGRRGPVPSCISMRRGGARTAAMAGCGR